MWRSLKIYDKNGKEIEDTIDISNEYSVNTIDVYVQIDGENDNSSFSVEVTDKWISYKIKKDEKYGVKVTLYAKQNTDIERFGDVTFIHNAEKIEKTISIKQKNMEYGLSITHNKTTEKGNEISITFNPTEKCTEVFTIEAVGGSRKWYIKTIKQYDVNNTDENKQMVMYDDSFEYSVKLDDESGKETLSITSYGKIYILPEGRHMEYEIEIGHKDVEDLTKTIKIQYN